MPHTPGPWRITYGPCIVANRPSDPAFPLLLAEIKTPIDGGAIHHAMACDNARLIAAAPDLLAALKECERIYSDDWTHGTHAARKIGVTVREAIRAAEPIDPRDPDPSREGIFRDHNCWKCHDGAKPCPRGNSRQCEYPHARND